MPRYARYAPGSEKQNRRRKHSYRGYKQPATDKYPLGFGTQPEKIVYAELVRRNIEFYYLNDVEFVAEDAEFFKLYQADFIIPSLKVVIEVQGAFWHTKPGTIESDAYKYAVYETFGWKPLFWWDFDIIQNVHKLFALEPLFAKANEYLNWHKGQNKSNSTEKVSAKPSGGWETVVNSKKGEYDLLMQTKLKGRSKTDTSKGIRTQNKNRAARLQYRKKPVQLKSSKSPYGSRSVYNGR